MDLDELLSVAREAARAGARTALSWRSGALLVEEKAASDDLVSQADRDTERIIRSVLARHRPDDAVLGEEDGDTAGTGRVRWIVDPIDGTTNYLYGRPDWAVSVAAADAADGRLLAGVVVEPALGLVTEARCGGGTAADGTPVPRLARHDLSRALVELNLGRPAQRPLAGRVVDALVPRVRDVRRGGSAAAALAQVATGRADAVWAPGLRAWDCAAGVLLVQEAGGTVGDLDGPTPGTWPGSGDVLAASDRLWTALREVLAPVWTTSRTPGRVMPPR
ncbi:inositol monophosphatase [Saccharothrix longispora]|uniref:inositol monophosphatase family protein n=1 Tax=Saccharothrix longispora TaxID=33920 RepID=UPI0028FD722A|nr:inositol monophosphatase [Saccharothrix longispora]MBY8848811.1 inositol monophosphatase [Saccharothrix sp. MB29]MDU0293972.1 inositol monophosphatase [Saccharothrix longispora]